MNKSHRQRNHITQAMIIENAAKLFAAHGYRRTSLDDIAEKLGVTHPALYHYFKNKQEILVKILEDTVTILMESASAIISSDESNEDKFFKLLINHIEYGAVNGLYLRIYDKEETEMPKGRMKRLRDQGRRYRSILVTMYRKGMIEGHFRPTDPKIAVYSLLGCCNWIYRWYDPCGSLSANEVARMGIDILKNGILLKHSNDENSSNDTTVDLKNKR